MAPPTKKIIQITAVQSLSQSSPTLFALADDGTIYRADHPDQGWAPDTRPTRRRTRGGITWGSTLVSKTN
jgi:hypothetical protein